MIEIVVYNWSANKSLEVVSDMRKSGFIQGLEFDWEYHPTIHKDWSGDIDTIRYTVFKFYKEELATWFRLRYE